MTQFVPRQLSQTTLILILQYTSSKKVAELVRESIGLPSN